jgi:predicted TIM-barrel fold metal-dependent hydrolase
MTDNHIHFGQFRDVYYDPFEITDTVFSSGITGMSFSTTSSCKDDVQYFEIENEITGFLSHVSYSSEVIHPYFWYIPDYINQSITIESAFNVVPYKGIKLHPSAHNWDFNNSLHLKALHGLFSYASVNNLPVLIHTGHSGVDSANRFERFIKEYSNVKCILAHCRPLDITIVMLSKYNNVYCDTAFVSENEIVHIVSAGFKNKIILGSDFPITHFFRTKHPLPGENPEISLREKYAEDITGWKETAFGECQWDSLKDAAK